MLWFMLALMGAFFVAIYFLELKRLVSSIDLNVAAGLIFLLDGIVLFSISLLNGIPEIGSQFILAVGLSVLFNIIAALFYLRALKTTDLSLAIPMMAFTPLFLVFTSSLILGENSHPDGIMGIVLVVFGSYILNMNAHHEILSPFKAIFKSRGLVYMLVAAVLLSFVANFDKMAMLNSDQFFAPAIVAMSIGIFFSSYSVLTGKKVGKNLFRYSKTIALAVASLVIGTILIFFSWTLQIVPYVVSISRMSVLFSVILGGMLLHEEGMLHRLTGAALMMGGAMLIVLSS